MDKFDTNDQESVARFILDNLPHHPLMTLGTVDGEGNPWVVCVNLSFDQEVNLIWKSLRAAQHSQHIAAHSQVSICIFSHSKESGDFALYTRAEAHAIEGRDELLKCIQVKYIDKGLPVPAIEELSGDGARRLYKAIITQAFVTDERHMKIPVDLEILRQVVQRKS